MDEDIREKIKNELLRWIKAEPSMDNIHMFKAFVDALSIEAVTPDPNKPA